METLDELHIGRSALLSAVTKLITSQDKMGIKSITEMSPGLPERARLIAEYEKRMIAKN